jgi:hypothetical protein
LPALLKEYSSNELVLLLYRYFDSHGKGAHLINWAIQHEVNITSTVWEKYLTLDSPQELCRMDSFVSQLFFVFLFGDLGKKYLSATVVPFVKKVIELSKDLKVKMKFLKLIEGRKQPQIFL